MEIPDGIKPKLPEQERPKPGIDIFRISEQVEAKKEYGTTFLGDIGDGQVTCYAVDPVSGQVSGKILPLEGEKLDRSIPRWIYFRTNADRINSRSALSLDYVDGELVYQDKNGKEYRAKSVDEMPVEIAGMLRDIQAKTVPNNAFNSYTVLMS